MNEILQQKSFPTEWSTKVHFITGSIEESLRSVVGDFANSIIITDELVWKHHATCFHQLTRSCKDIIVLPSDEQHKTLDTVQDCLHRALSNQTVRDTTIIAIGGGVVTDIAGFTASILLRGVPWVAVPTTIVGAVDAAIGGKTGVDTSHGKNLIGTFYPPAHVLIDTKFFETLPDREISAGWGEVVKYGLLQGGEIWKAITQVDFTIPPSHHLVKLCVETKIRLVNLDPYDRAERRLLNLGHTAGHALEAATGFDVFRHGEAVLWGLGVASSLSYKKQYITKDEYTLIKNQLLRIQLPSIEIDPIMILQKLQTDKKRSEQNLRWILLQGIGNGLICEDVSPAMYEESITENCLHLKEGKAI